MTIEGKIPCRPHLKKFALWLEMRPKDDVIDLSSTGLVATVLRSMLEGKASLNARTKVNQELTDVLTFSIPSRYVEKSQIVISSQKINYFDIYLNRLFHQILLNRVLVGTLYQVQEKEIILQYLRDIGLDEDEYSFDAAKKSSYRLRKELAEKVA